MLELTDWLITGSILLAVGAVAGVLAGLLGVGGGIVIVPALFWLAEIGLMPVGKDVAIHFAVATSLATIIPTSISSANAHNKRGSVNIDMFKSWAPFIVIGSLIGSYLATIVDAPILTGIFGVIAAIVTINMLNPRPFTLAKAPPQPIVTRALIASPIGIFSSMMGIGGGTLSVPVMTLLSFPVHLAVGTASLFGLLIAIPAVLVFASAGQNIEGLMSGSLGYINIPAAIIISISTFACAPFGVRLAHYLDARRLRLAFAIFLGISATKMLYEAFIL